MSNIVPQMLKKGDEIRIVAPSLSLKISDRIVARLLKSALRRWA